jgi:hypothetical protein
MDPVFQQLKWVEKNASTVELFSPSGQTGYFSIIRYIYFLG